MESEISLELQNRFRRFREIYLEEQQRQRTNGSSGWLLANEPYKVALREVPLAPDELRLYKKLFALQSVNGGTLFPDLPPECEFG